MEAKTKRNLIIWGIVFLVLLNVSSLGTIWYHRYQFRNNKMNTSLRDKAKDRMSTRTMGRRQRTSAFITRNLDLTDKQQLKIDSIWRHYNDVRQGIEEEMEANRRDMGMIMSKADLDTIAFYEISALQSHLMLALDHSMVDMNLALRTTLNSDQMVFYLKMLEMGNKRRLKCRPSDSQKRSITK
jgi:hypothetical protein